MSASDLVPSIPFAEQLSILYLSCAQAEYDGNAYQTNPVQSAFTRRREIFVGEGASISLVDVVPSVDIVHPPPYMLIPLRSSNQFLYDGAPHETSNPCC